MKKFKMQQQTFINIPVLLTVTHEVHRGAGLTQAADSLSKQAIMSLRRPPLSDLSLLLRDSAKTSSHIHWFVRYSFSGK